MPLGATIGLYRPPLLALLRCLAYRCTLQKRCFLHGKGQLFNMNDFLIGTAVWSVGLFFWLLAKPNLGQAPVWSRLSQWVFPMYVTHLFVIIVLFNVAGVLGLTQGAKDALVFIGTLIGSYLLVVALDKTPMSFARLRLRFA